MATYTLIRQLFSRYLEMNNRIGKMYQKIDKHLNSTFMATFLICLIIRLNIFYFRAPRFDNINLAGKQMLQFTVNGCCRFYSR